MDLIYLAFIAAGIAAIIVELMTGTLLFLGAALGVCTLAFPVMLIHGEPAALLWVLGLLWLSLVVGFVVIRVLNRRLPVRTPLG